MKVREPQSCAVDESCKHLHDGRFALRVDQIPERCLTVDRHHTAYRATRTVVQENLARVERLIEETQQCECQGKRRERLARSRDELPGPGIVNKREPRSGAARSRPK